MNIGHVIFIAMASFFVLVAYVTLTVIPQAIKSHEVISPYPGIKCVVVSRAMNTSVDCWKEK